VTYVLLIYRSGPAVRSDSTLAQHRALQAEASARGELHAVAQLGDPSGAITVKRTQVAHEVNDGPYIETKEWLVGFYLLDCATEADAVARAKQLADPDHVIEVRPVAWRWKG
jgi:hypothetical protein